MKNLRHGMFALAAMVAVPTAAPASAATLNFNVGGGQATDVFGSAQNSVWTFNIGAGARVSGIGYSVNITAASPSYLSEATLGITASDLATGIFLSPGIDDDASGTAGYTGFVDLAALGLDYAVGADGILRVEYFENFSDGLNPDSVLNSGTITVIHDGIAAVPEPASWAMMIGGVGAIGVAIRRRRRTGEVAATA